MKRFNTYAVILLASIWLGVPSADVLGATPSTLSYQGVLTDGAGEPVANGSYDITFALYGAASGGTALWTETQSLTTTDGIFSAVLGSVTVIGLGFDVPYWLGIAADGGAEMTPRAELTSAAYAFEAKSVENGAIATAHLADDAVTADKIAADAVDAAAIIDLGVTNAELADSTISGAKLADGHVVRSLNGMTDQVFLAAGANVTINASGDSLVIAATGGGGGSGPHNTLDLAYDQDAPGAGRTITADSGPVTIAGSDGLDVTATGANDAITVTHAGAAGDGIHIAHAGGGDAISVRIDPGGTGAVLRAEIDNNAHAGPAVHITHDGIGRGIDVTLDRAGSMEDAIHAVTHGSGSAIYGEAGDTPPSESPAIAGVAGASRDDVGASGFSDNAAGVHGVSENSVGVYGQANVASPTSVPATAGVAGASRDEVGTSGYSDNSSGVRGESTNDSGVYGRAGSVPATGVPATAGVAGASRNEVGTSGYSDNSNGVRGESASVSGVYGRAGSAPATGVPAIAGVAGASRDEVGTSGYSDNAAGVYGNSQNDPGVRGESEIDSGVYGQAGSPPASGVPAVAGIAGASRDEVGTSGYSDNAAGVYGNSENDPGVRGESEIDSGVYGQAGSPPVSGVPAVAGVAGASLDEVGASGYSENSAGVYGNSVNDAGVRGESEIDFGVYGQAGSPPISGVPAVAGVAGASLDEVGAAGYSENSAGVFGQSENGPGVVGLSQNLSGVHGAAFGFDETVAGVVAEGSGTLDGAAALQIREGAIRVGGLIRPAGTVTAVIPEEPIFSCSNSCPEGGCTHDHVIGWYKDGEFENPLINAVSIILVTLTAYGTPPGVQYTLVLTGHVAGVASYRVAVFGDYTYGDCEVPPAFLEIHYQIITPNPTGS